MVHHVEILTTTEPTLTTPETAARPRRPKLVEDWQSGERHLAYTIIAVLLIGLLGAIIVPRTLSAEEPVLESRQDLLAQRYMEAIVKVPGATPPSSLQQVAKQFGTDGGDTCASTLDELRTSVVKRPAPVNGVARPSFIDPTALEQVRTALRVYCPARDAQFAAFVRKA